MSPLPQNERKESERKMPSIIEEMRSAINNSGGGKQGFFFLPDGQKKKIHFLRDLDKPFKMTMHEKWAESGLGSGWNYPCQVHYGEECQWCDSPDEKQRDKEYFVWQIWDYEDEKVKLFSFKANDNSPVPHMLAMFEEVGTLVDRPYTIVRTGKGTSTSYTLIPLTQSAKPDKASIYKKEALLELFKKAFPLPSSMRLGSDATETSAPEEEFEEEPEAPAKPAAKAPAAKAAAPADDDDDDIFGDEDE